MASRRDRSVIAVPLLCCAFVLSACGGGTPEPAPEPPAPQIASDEDLTDQAEIMQKTILEGAVAGGATGFGISLALGGNDDDNQAAFSLGFGAGAAAGTYVAFVQKRYAAQEARIERIREDMAKSAGEMQTSIDVMRQVLTRQKAELAASQTLAAIRNDSVALDQETAEANENLAQMNAAIDGAEARRQEFAETRSLTLAEGEAISPIDPELELLSARIEEMRAIADDLATTLAPVES